MLPMCVAGDFNVTLNGRTYGPRRSRALLETALEHNNLQCYTDCFEYNIDHICLTSGWADEVRTQQWAPPHFNGRPVSDHAGVHVDVTLAS